MRDQRRTLGELTDAERRLNRLADKVVECPYPVRRIGMLSLEERLAVALILDRRDLFVDGDFTILQAIEFLGPEWVRMATAVQRVGMHEMEDD